MEFLVENAYFIVVTVIGNVTVIVTVIVHGYISIRLNKLQEGTYQAYFSESIITIKQGLWKNNKHLSSVISN